MRTLLLAGSLAAPLVTATEAIVLEIPGFAQHGKGWMAELLREIRLGDQPLQLSFQPPARAVGNFYKSGQGDFLAADLWCGQPQAHFLSLGLKDYEIFIVRRGNTIPSREKPPLAGETVLVVRGFNHQYPRNNPRIIWHETTGIQQALDMLRAGRANFLFTYMAPAEDVMLKQKSRRQFDFDQTKAITEVVPALSLRSTASGWLLGEQLQSQLRSLQRSGRYAQIMRSNAMHEWHIRDGLNGKFNLGRAEDCPVQPHAVPR